MRASFYRTLLSCCLAFATLMIFCSPEATAAEDKLPFRLPVRPQELPRRAVVETSRGPIQIDFFREQAPITVKNFEHLGKKNFYNNLSFHRLVDGYLIQGGDPQGNGRGGAGYTLPPEFSTLEHIRGTVGMARNRDEINPERRSNGSQFYICLSRCAWLNGSYTVFAHVTAGIENADALRPGDKILRVSFPVNQ